MKGIINTIKNFPNMHDCCNFIIHEKSKKLIDVQKKNITSKKLSWKNKLIFNNNYPKIFIANEFFDALPVKHLIKKEKNWYEKFVKLLKNNGEFTLKKIDIKKYKKDLSSQILKNNKFIEYSPLSLKYLKEISKTIKSNNGGLLLIDYGFSSQSFKDTLQAIEKHKFANILGNIGNRDITYNLNFNFLKKFISNLKNLKSLCTTQRNFLLKMGIIERAEIISKNLLFSKKAEIFYRVNRLIDKNKMGELFKVMFITKNNSSFKLGF